MGDPLWLESVFGYQAERSPIPRPSNKPLIPINPTAIGVLHTTEGKTVDSALAQFRMRLDPPHFCVGENRIVQTRPLNFQAAALHDPANRDAYVQIEIVAFSQTTLWLPGDPSLKPLVALIAQITLEHDVPLTRPDDDWKDDCSDMPLPWAVNNKRRKQAIYPNRVGWYSHLECVGQAPTWHWDVGALSYTSLFASVLDLLG